MDIVCCICQRKYDEKEGEGVSHGYCSTRCVNIHLISQGLEPKDETNTNCKLVGQQEP
jgi:hypothetical protein